MLDEKSMFRISIAVFVNAYYAKKYINLEDKALSIELIIELH